MDAGVYLDHYLKLKRQRRQAVFADAASTSFLMGGVVFLYKHSQYVFDAYCRLFMLVRLRLRSRATADDCWKEMDRLHADAIDTYHVLWVAATSVCYTVGWHLYDLEGDTTLDWLYWAVPLGLCTYRMFDISAALIEMYFGASDAKHHQFRILLHAALHFLCVAVAFALFFVFADWGYSSFSTTDDTGEIQYQFSEWPDAIYDSLLTIVFWGGNQDPQNGFGKFLVIVEVLIGFILATFIFLNITQIWTGTKSSR